jgi:hypothetical protein
MRHSKICGAVLGLALALAALSPLRAEEPIETDRDSFTPATTTVEYGRLVLESSYSFVDNVGVPETHSFPELLLRLGVAERIELRLGANYEIGGEASSISGIGGGIGDFDATDIESESSVLYGVKFAVTDQDGLLPRSAMILQGHTSTDSPDFDTHAVVTYVWGSTIAEHWHWDSAIRAADGGTEEDQFNRWAPSTVIKYEFAERWNAHLEYFGIYTNGRDEELQQSYISPGMHYLLNPNCEIGVRVGWGLGEDSANFFSNVGLGVRF